MNVDDFVSETGPVKSIDLETEKICIALTGDIDMHSSPDVRVAMTAVIAKKVPCVVMDLHEVSYMDSSGIATLVEVLQRIKRYKGKLVPSGLQPRVKSVFEIAKLTDIFEIRSDVSEVQSDG